MRNRRRDARHPVVVCTIGSWAVLSVSQLWFGPEGSNVVRGMEHHSQIAFAAILLTSSILCLVSAVVGHEPWGAHIERAGMFGCAVALGFYSINLPSVVASWNTTMAFALAGSATGCIIRAGLVGRMIRHRETW